MTDPIRAALERLVSDIDCLVDSSSGVAGLYLNGDIASWAELMESGRSSSWVGDAIAAARAALAALPPDGPAVPEGREPAAVTVEPSDSRPAPVPAGEVAELVNWLRETGDLIQPSHLAVHQRYKRTADLLEQRQAAPVSVSERWPEFSDCDRSDDRVWCFNPVLSHWELSRINRTIHSHWRPFNALPLPNGEVKE